MPTPQDWFSGRTAVLATMHGKEQVIAPLFGAELGMDVRLPLNLNADFNSDRFGTFTRDIPRRGSQLEAARAKAKAVLALTGLDAAIASEGSFTPHPFLPFVAQNRELVIFIDQMQGLEVCGEAISTQTNFAHQTLTTWAEAVKFAERIGFPDHGLVVQVGQDASDPDSILKGITDWDKLEQAIATGLQRSPTVNLETDMRALYNPTRMQVIQTATQNLVNKLQRTCPACGCPGFGGVDFRYGLPCELCHQPTDLIQTEIEGCQRCDFRQELPYDNGRLFADPAQCQYCNP